MNYLTCFVQTEQQNLSLSRDTCVRFCLDGLYVNELNDKDKRFSVERLRYGKWFERQRLQNQGSLSCDKLVNCL